MLTDTIVIQSESVESQKSAKCQQSNAVMLFLWCGTSQLKSSLPGILVDVRLNLINATFGIYFLHLVAVTNRRVACPQIASIAFLATFDVTFDVYLPFAQT